MSTPGAVTLGRMKSHPYFGLHARAVATRLELAARILVLSPSDRAALAPIEERLTEADAKVYDFFHGLPPNAYDDGADDLDLAVLTELVVDVEEIAAEMEPFLPPFRSTAIRAKRWPLTRLPDPGGARPAGTNGGSPGPARPARRVSRPTTRLDAMQPR